MRAFLSSIIEHVWLTTLDDWSQFIMPRRRCMISPKQTIIDERNSNSQNTHLDILVTTLEGNTRVKNFNLQLPTTNYETINSGGWWNIFRVLLGDIINTLFTLGEPMPEHRVVKKIWDLFLGDLNLRLWPLRSPRTHMKWAFGNIVLITMCIF